MNKFRRNTHTPDGKYKQEFNPDSLTVWQRVVDKRYRHILHLLCSAKPLSFREVIEEARKDITNYSAGPFDLETLDDRSPIPTQEEIAMAIVRLIEANFVEVVNADNTR